MDLNCQQIHSKKAMSATVISALRPTGAKFLKEIIGSESWSRQMFLLLPL